MKSKACFRRNQVEEETNRQFDEDTEEKFLGLVYKLNCFTLWLVNKKRLVNVANEVRNREKKTSISYLYSF